MKAQSEKIEKYNLVYEISLNQMFSDNKFSNEQGEVINRNPAASPNRTIMKSKKE